jgi:hypothetical protein
MIVCAALLIKDPVMGEEIILPCHRHGDGFALLKYFGHSKKEVVEQGFIDHRGCFYTRAGAFQHAIECGQLSATARYFKQERGEEELYSEDLY